MKNTNPAIAFLALFFALSLVFSSQTILAQNAEDNKLVKVKIIQNVDGKSTVIEKTFSEADLDALEDFLKEFDVNLNPEELSGTKQMEISIRKTAEPTKTDNEDMVVKVEVISDELPVPHSAKGFLGVFIETMDSDSVNASERNGVRVTEVIKETAAENAGLKEGDVITQVNGEPVTDSEQFRELIGSFKPDDEVAITYWRDGKESSVKAPLGESKMLHEFHMMLPPGKKEFGCHGMMPPMKFDIADLKDRPFLGIVPEFSEENQTKGVLIKEVIEKTTAQGLGLQAGDVIVKINEKPVQNFDGLREILSLTKVGDEVKVEWTRNGRNMNGSAPIKSKAECQELCLKFDASHVAHCGEPWVKRFEYNFNGNKEEVKEHLENAIVHLEGELAQLKEQLRKLDESSVEQKDNEETNVTITIEDVSTNNLAAQNFFFSPNPNNGTFNLSFELPEKGKITIRILDVNNKEVYEESLGKFSGKYEKQIDVSDSPKGIYFLQITQNGKSLNKKIVIQ